MAELGVSITCAKSPQAKGRVERMNGTLQDRLVKALRVEGIVTIAAANAYLQMTFLPQLNARFALAPADATDVHRTVDAAQLTTALCEREDRVVSKDQCVMWAGRVLQLHSRMNLAHKRVEVRRLLDGQTHVLRHDALIPHRTLTVRPPKTVAQPPLLQRNVQEKKPWKPPANHPWRGRHPSSADPSGQGRSAPSCLRWPALRDPAPTAVQRQSTATTLTVPMNNSPPARTGKSATAEKAGGISWAMLSVTRPRLSGPAP